MNSKIVTCPTVRKPNERVLDGEILTATDREHCLARVRGALRLAYAVGQTIGSRRLQGAALDALAAARGLA